MPEITLTAVSRTQGNNAALKDGHITTPGFQLDFHEIPVLVNAFRQMVRQQAFDVCEMAFTTYLCAKAHGKPFTALPIFLVRGFHHGAMVRNTELGITQPKDLEGRRVGVNRGYTVTTGVWARGILQDEYGVDLDAVTWVPSGDEHVAEYRLPDNVIPMSEDDDLADLVESGGLAGAVGTTIDRPGVAPLIPDADAAAFAALRRDGLYPINHLVVIRDELTAQHRGLAAAIFEAFAASKAGYVDRLRSGSIAEPTPVDRLHARVMEVLDDPLPYGIEPNQGMIEKLIDHAVRQRILTHRPDPTDLFVEETHHLVG